MLPQLLQRYRSPRRLAFAVLPVLLTLEKIGFTTGEAENIHDAANSLDMFAKKYGTSNLTETNDANTLAHTLLTKIPSALRGPRKAFKKVTYPFVQGAECRERTDFKAQ